MNSNEASVGDFTVAIKRQLRVISYLAAPLIAVFVGIALGWPSLYRSSGVIRIEQQQAGADRRNVDTYAEYFVQTLTEQVLTKARLENWVETLGLFADESWTPDEKIIALSDGLSTNIVTTPVIDPVSGREREVVTGFQVSYYSRSPEMANTVAKAATNAFLAENRASRRSRGEQEIEFFESEAENYRAQIAEVESRLADFKEQNNRRLPELVQLNMSAMERVERDLDTTQLQIDNLRRERAIIQSQLSQIPSTSDESLQQLAALQNEYVRVSSIYQENHPTVVSVRKQIELLSATVDSAAAVPILRQQLEQIAIELADARQRYSEDHPDVRALVRSQDALDERIHELSQQAPGSTDVPSTNDLYVQLNTQVKGLDAQISGLTDRIAELRAKRNEYEQLILETPQVEREYQELMRDLANARSLYEETQQKQRQAELAVALEQGAQGEQLVLAQAPGIPQVPAWPPRIAIIGLGVMLALGLGIGAGTMRELTSATVRGSRDTLELCGAPPIALIPTIYNRSARLMRRLYVTGFTLGVSAIGALAYVAATNL